MNKEKEIREFFNERIRVSGYEKFTPEIGENESGWMILDFLKKRVDITKKILDAGCGEGRFSKHFVNTGADITSMDFSEEYVYLDRKNIPNGTFIVGSVTNIPIPSNSFDYIFTVDVLQHVPDLEKALKEFWRVLKKNGTLIIVDKNRWGLNSKTLIPQIIIQKYKELTEWRYSEFKERWFVPEKFKILIRRYFNDVEYHYISEKNKYKLFKKFPKLNFFVAWVAKK